MQRLHYRRKTTSLSRNKEKRILLARIQSCHLRSAKYHHHLLVFYSTPGHRHRIPTCELILHMYTVRCSTTEDQSKSPSCRCRLSVPEL